jgi:hypothetical protein
VFASIAAYCVLCLQAFPLPKVLRFLHPTRIATLLRLAVNQQDATAAAAVVLHLSKGSAVLEHELTDEHQQQLDDFVCCERYIQDEEEDQEVIELLQQTSKGVQGQQQQDEQQQQQPSQQQQGIKQPQEQQQHSQPGQQQQPDVELQQERQQPGQQQANKLQQQQQQHSQPGQQQEPSTAAELLQQQEQEREQILAIYVQQRQQLTPQLVDQLLQLANARGHWKLLLQLQDQLPEAQQMPVSTLGNLLRSAVRSKGKMCFHREALVQELCMLPAADELSSAEVSSLLKDAVTRRQFVTLQELTNLTAVVQISSEQVTDVAMAAVNNSWDVALVVLDEEDLLDEIEPQQLLLLLQRAILLASVVGAGMPQPWRDMASISPNPAGSAAVEKPVEYCVLECLVKTSASNALPREGLLHLLLAAAGLGNVAVLSLLLASLHGADSQKNVVQLLKVAAQLRNSSMVSAVVRKLNGNLVAGVHFSELKEAVFAALVRTNEVPQLLHLIDALSRRAPQHMQTELLGMVQLAMQLNRFSTIKALCSRQGYFAARGLTLLLSESELNGLVRMAVARNNPSMLHCLLQLPAAEKLPAGGLQLVMEVCTQQAQQPSSARTPGRWLHLEKLPALQQLQQEPHQIASGQQQQQDKAAGIRQQQQQEEDQQGQAAHDQQQQQRQIDVAALQEAIKAGKLPDQIMRDHLAPGAAKTKAAMTPLEYFRMQMQAVNVDQLLSVALQLPVGQQQQAWVELLCQSLFAGYFERCQLASLLVTAVQAAYVNDSTAALRMLCRAWRRLCDVQAVYPAVAAAVQLGCMPALQVLLASMRAEALQFDAGDITALLLWGICSTSGSSSGSSETPIYTTCGGAFVECGPSLHPMPPTCTAARAEVFAAICKLPAAQRVDCHSLVGLLLYAMQQGNVEAVQQLCKLDAAAELDAVCVRALLRWARVVGSRPGRDAVVGALAGLRGARRLTGADVSAVLQLYASADGLMGWSAVESEAEGVVPAELYL